MMIQLPHPDATSALLTGSTISANAAPHPYSDIVEKGPNVKRLFFFSDYLGERVTSGLRASKRAFVEANPRKAAEMFSNPRNLRSLSKRRKRC